MEPGRRERDGTAEAPGHPGIRERSGAGWLRAHPAPVVVVGAPVSHASACAAASWLCREHWRRCRWFAAIANAKAVTHSIGGRRSAAQASAGSWRIRATWPTPLAAAADSTSDRQPLLPTPTSVLRRGTRLVVTSSLCRCPHPPRSAALRRFRVERHWRPARGVPPPSVGLGAVLARARPREDHTRRSPVCGLRASLRAAASRAAEEAGGEEMLDPASQLGLPTTGTLGLGGTVEGTCGVFDDGLLPRVDHARLNLMLVAQSEIGTLSTRWRRTMAAFWSGVKRRRVFLLMGSGSPLIGAPGVTFRLRRNNRGSPVVTWDHIWPKICGIMSAGADRRPDAQLQSLGLSHAVHRCRARPQRHAGRRQAHSLGSPGARRGASRAER